MTVKAIETTSDALITLYLTQGTKDMIISRVAIRDQGDQGGHAQLITSILDQVHD